MSIFRPSKLIVVTIVYWFLLLYMIADLTWWFIALEKQNTLISSIKVAELNLADAGYTSKLSAIKRAKSRKTMQYIGEGLTFLAVILVGAIYVFRAIRRQLKLAQQQQNFMMAITHELKTPIAVTQLNLETLQKRKLDEEKQQKLIANTLQEANRLNVLCNNILFAAQLDAGKYTTELQTLNLSELLETAVNDCKKRYTNREIQKNIAADALISGDAFLLQLLVSNLLENAIKYSPKDQPVKVQLSTGERKLKMEIIDWGAGVADNEKKKIFDKFYRTGNENTRRAQGTGLGLYLCKKICQSHKAVIFVTDNQPSGSNFTVIFNSTYG